VLTTSASYRMIASDLPRALDRTAKKPQVARETEYYLKNIEKVKSIDDFLADDRLFAYAMKAFGLGEMAYAKAFMRKVLTEGTSSPDSFANKLTDKRYREFAETFDFAQFGAATTIFDSTRQGTVDRYLRQTLEEDAGQQNEGVRLALYFQRKASSIKSAYAILADPALTKIVQTVLDLPAASSAMDIDKQAQLIASRLDLSDFQDPDKVNAFLDRFTNLWSLRNGTAMASVPSIVIGQPIEAGISADLLATLQNIRLGGF
jgi:hypothetical protein